MLVQLRKIVKPAKKRLAELLNKELPTVDEEGPVSAETHLRELKGAKRETQMQISRIQKTVELIQQHLEHFEGQEGSDGEKEKIEEFMNDKEATENEEQELGYATMVLDAQDKVVELELHLKDLDKCIQEQSEQVQYNTPTPAIGGNLTKSCKVKLPELKLPTFDGEQSKWPEFWAMFESSIHDQEMMPVLKFTYLKGQLKNEALNAISGLLVTNENYQIALDILKDRYGNTNSLKRQLMKKLRDLAPSGMKPRELRNTIDEQNKTLRQLQNLGENLQHSERIPWILEKYPLKFLKEVNLLKNPGETLESTSVQNLMGYLHQAVKDHENLAELAAPAFRDEEKSQDGKMKKQFNSNGIGSLKRQFKSSGEEANDIGSSVEAMTAEVRGKGTGDKNGDLKTSSYGARKWQLSCAFCERQHYSDSCQTVKTPEERQQLLIKQQLCIKCFQPCHNGSKCNAKVKLCWYCKGNHNTALCKGKGQTAQKVSTSVEEEIEVVTSHTANTQEKDTASLMKKEVKLSSPLEPRKVVKKTHLLFDNGRKKSFIQEDLQKKRNMKRKTNESQEVTEEQEMKSPQAKLKLQKNVQNKMLTEKANEVLPVNEVMAKTAKQVIDQSDAKDVLKTEDVVSKLPSRLETKRKTEEMADSMTTDDKNVNLKVKSQSNKRIKRQTVKKENEDSTVDEKKEISSTEKFKQESCEILDDATVNEDDRALEKSNENMKPKKLKFQMKFHCKDRNLPTNGPEISLNKKLKKDKTVLEWYDRFLQDQEMIEEVDPVKLIGPKLRNVAHHPPWLITVTIARADTCQPVTR